MTSMAALTRPIARRISSSDRATCELVRHRAFAWAPHLTATVRRLETRNSHVLWAQVRFSSRLEDCRFRGLARRCPVSSYWDCHRGLAAPDSVLPAVHTLESPHSTEQPFSAPAQGRWPLARFL